MALGKWFRGQSGVAAAPQRTFAVDKPDAEWRGHLSAEQYRVLREHGTERPFTSKLNQEKRPGMFVCAGCGQDVFDAGTKFESGTGWPSFHTPVESGVETSEDFSFLMRRVEVHCARCGGHLGHVFDDGPQPTGKRYCINGVSLDFRPAGKAEG